MNSNSLIHKINNQIMPMVNAVEIIKDNIEDKELCLNLCQEVLKEKDNLSNLIAELKDLIKAVSHEN